MTVRPFRPPASTPSLVFYVSGHGFGHASRDVEVINALRARQPGLRIVIRTTAARWLFEASVHGPVEYYEVECDTGVTQIDSLRLDEADTVLRAAEFYRTIGARAAHEAEALRALHARLVVGDIPPLACAAAAAADIPAILLGNFTWDWIYEGYADSMLDGGELLNAVREAYRSAALALRLPMSGGFGPVAHVTRDIPLVARRSKRTPDEVRARLELPAGRPVVLASFGGHGLQGLDTAVLGANRDYTILTTADPGLSPPPNVVAIDTAALYREGLRYEDLVAAADVVVTKPGYGIVAEAIANDAALLYTSRGRFVEYDVLVAAMHRLTRCRYIPNSDLLGGHWAGHLDRLLQEPRPVERTDTTGAEVAAGEIVKMF